jgi:hypothetical protein
LGQKARLLSVISSRVLQIVGEIISSVWGGDEDDLFTCGQGVGLIKRIRTVQEVIEEFVTGSQMILEKTAQMLCTGPEDSDGAIHSRK